MSGTTTLKTNEKDDRPIYNKSANEILAQLQTTSKGLATNEAQKRLQSYGPNLLRSKKKTDSLTLLVGQFKSPIIILLIIATGLSIFLGDQMNAIIILVIILISGILGLWQERGATNSVKKLMSIIQIKTTALRDEEEKDIAIEEIVPGDVVKLRAGDVIPADGIILESKDLFVNEATLTGETYPVEKMSGIMPPETPLNSQKNMLFMGTHAVSGTATSVIAYTGKHTEFGRVSEQLSLKPPETEFERGVRRFGFLLMEVTLLLVIAIFAINVYLARSVLESFLFSLALAVGLTPQLLPAIISINLAHGARIMAEKKVIVKRLVSIENFGSMNMLCSDKTGTLTEGSVKIHSALDIYGNENNKVFLYAYLNAFYQTGFKNPIDEAITSHHQLDITSYRKLDEIPYDFIRKHLTVQILSNDQSFIITKGAFQNVLNICDRVETLNGQKSIDDMRDDIQKRFEDLSGKGFRVIGIAYKKLDPNIKITRDKESNMIFLGFLVLFDPIKQRITDTIKDLKHLGVHLKIITGDNRLIAGNVGRQIGFSKSSILTGSDIHKMSDEALIKRVNQLDIFAEIEPNQKERIIQALKKSGNVVGYLGDGINDASALHTADVGISVDSAVDVAKESADIVLLEKDLSVLCEGVKEGRKTFANTLKYVFMATSANFGNMFSMAGASLFLPFLPLLPRQILLTNFMTDLPEMTIATDNVDRELVNRPRRWNIKFIKSFMLVFGILSSVFDYLTFGVLLFILHASPNLFRTGWFVESVISATLIVFVIRTRKSLFRSIAGKHLIIVTIFVVSIVLILPFTAIGILFGFSPIPFSFLLAIGSIILLYIIVTEFSKKIFYKKISSI
ncbi:magnesium-translocating P-type ATPase [[Eubacterium] cellulosolvens]